MSQDLIKEINQARPKFGQDLKAEREALEKIVQALLSEANSGEVVDLISVLGEIIKQGSDLSIQEAITILKDLGLGLVKAKNQKTQPLKVDRKEILPAVLEEHLKALEKKSSHPFFVPEIRDNLYSLVKTVEEKELLDKLYNLLNRSLKRLEKESQGGKTPAIEALLQIKSIIKSQSRKISLQAIKH